MITREEVKRIFAEIKAQENEFPVRINFSEKDIRDEKHLDCVWYGGDVGTIEYRGHTIIISAVGEIRLYGMINGEEFSFVDKNNSGDFFREYGDKFDDESLTALLESDDENNYLTYENNNWFEFDILTPDKEFIDCGYFDNVLDDNILDCFLNIDDPYLQTVDSL